MAKMEISESNIKKFQFELERRGSDFETASHWLSQASPMVRRFIELRLASRAEELLFSTEIALGKCESPIEQTLLSAVLVRSQEVGFDTVDLAARNPQSSPNSFCELMVECQKEIENFRVDFCFTAKLYDSRLAKKFSSRSVLVECDGHEFHERTKEQAKRDKSRDRQLQKYGHRVLHFTGSEIFNTPFECADEILRFIEVF